MSWVEQRAMQFRTTSIPMQSQNNMNVYLICVCISSKGEGLQGEYVLVDLCPCSLRAWLTSIIPSCWTFPWEVVREVSRFGNKVTIGHATQAIMIVDFLAIQTLLIVGFLEGWYLWLVCYLQTFKHTVERVVWVWARNRISRLRSALITKSVTQDNSSLLCKFWVFLSVK